MQKFITRFAPSPSGTIHIGNIRTAYFNWLAARSSGGRFVLRIDDTDLDRSKPEYIQVILDAMDWLGLDYDDIQYQSKRLGRYKDVADLLKNKGLAGKHFNNDTFVLYPKDIPDSFYDKLAGDVKITDRDKDLMIPNQDQNGIVLLRSDGSPTYHFACVVDDIDMGINCIIRGVDHLTNTARQVAIYTALDAPLPQFCHIGLIFKDGKKLSKRDGAASMLYYRDKSYDPDALLNCMARLGWGPKIDDKTTAILPRDKMLELFLSGGSMRNTPANLDLVKLDSFDRKYKALKKKQNII